MVSEPRTPAKAPVTEGAGAGLLARMKARMLDECILSSEGSSAAAHRVDKRAINGWGPGSSHVDADADVGKVSRIEGIWEWLESSRGFINQNWAIMRPTEE